MRFNKRQREPVQEKISNFVWPNATKLNTVRNNEKNNTAPRMSFKVPKSTRNSFCFTLSSMK